MNNFERQLEAALRLESTSGNIIGNKVFERGFVYCRKTEKTKYIVDLIEFMRSGGNAEATIYSLTSGKPYKSKIDSLSLIAGVGIMSETEERVALRITDELKNRHDGAVLTKSILAQYLINKRKQKRE